MKYTSSRRPLHTMLFAVLGTFALLTAACGGSDKGSSGSEGASESSASDCPVDALENADGVVDITLWHAIVGLAADTVEQFAEEYNASQDKVKVTVESQGANYEEQQTKFLAALRDPSTLPDIMLAEDTNTQSMIDSQAALPAQACIDADPKAGEVYDNLIPAVAKGYSVEGVQWPAAFGVSTPVIYYNKAHFRAAGLDPEKPPANLAEVRADAQVIKDAKAAGKIVDADGKPVPDGAPFVFRADAWWLENLSSSAKNELVNENNGRDGLGDESKLLNPTTTEWSEWMKAMTDDGLQKTIAYSATFDGYLSVATQSASMLIETSTAGTTVDALINGTMRPEDVGADAGTDLSGLAFPDLDLGVGQLPGPTEAGSGQIGGNAWYMIGAGRSPEQIAAAWDFLKWINQTPQLVKWTEQGSYLPVFSNAEEDPGLQAYFKDTRPGAWLATSLESLKKVDPEFPGPVIGPYKEFRSAVRAAIEDSLIGGKPVAESFDAANTKFQEALDTYKAEVGG